MEVEYRLKLSSKRSFLNRLPKDKKIFVSVPLEQNTSYCNWLKLLGQAEIFK